MKRNLDCGDFDAVKMVREIRNNYYKVTKNMTAEEKSKFDRKELENYYKHLETLNLDDYNFPFIRKK
ncbi:MAG: hypothetical protein LBC74_09700 [Planctomycetaceae bacterium]|jgi:hypothetical protein|nr:hypothetical protein [Planctomycetaceae bacterium]